MRTLTIVTGGAGFIGSELVRQLVERGDRVVVVDNFVNGKRENLAGLPSDQVIVLAHDVRRLDGLLVPLREAATVFHLACLGVRHSVHSPIENHDVNATATLHLVQACRDAGVPRFVHVSSSEVFGTARWTPMNEDHPTYPSTPYGAAKLAGEAYVRAFHQTYGYPTVIVRPFNTFGPRSHHEGDCGEVIPRFLLRGLAGRPLVIFGDGTQTRDFTYVADTASGILRAGSSDDAVGETIVIGSGHEVSINDLAREVMRVAGAPDAVVQHEPPRPGDVGRLCADATRARRLLGFVPHVSLTEGLERLRDWYRSQDVAPGQLLEEEVVHNWKG